MKPASSIVGLAFVAIASLSSGNAAERDVTPDPLAATLLARVAAEDGPACVVAGVVGETTRVAFACAKGAGPVALDRDSIFEIGSITKGFTGILLADMVRRGEVSPSDPAAKYARPGAPLPARNGKQITLLDLVTQTSGLPRLPPMRFPDPINPYAEFSVDDLYEGLARTELATDVGTTFLYSNFGFMWLGELISRAAARPYATLLEERILGPLGMKSSAVKLSPELARRVVKGHDTRYRAVAPWEFQSELEGAGALRSSMDDMLRFAAALAGRRDTPLKDAIDLALKPERPAGPGAAVGYAWMVRERPQGPLYWHNGGTGGFRSNIVVDRAARTAAVVLVDAAVSFDDLAFHLVDPAIPMKARRVEIALDADKRAQYVGSYEIRPGFVLRIENGPDTLIVHPTGQGALPLFAEGPDRFFHRVVDAQIVFRRAADGTVDGLTLHQAGREIPARRLP